MIGENGKESNGDQTNSKQKSNGDQTNTKQILNYVSQLSVIQGIKVTNLFLQSFQYVYPIDRIPSPSPLKVQLNNHGSHLPFTTEVQYNPNATTMGNHLHI